MKGGDCVGQVALWPELVLALPAATPRPEYFPCPRGCALPDGSPVYLEGSGRDWTCDECGKRWFPWGAARFIILDAVRKALNGVTWPSCRALAKLSGVSVGTVHHHLIALQDAGLIPPDRLTHVYHQGLRTGWAFCAQDDVDAYEAALAAPYGMGRSA